MVNPNDEVKWYRNNCIENAKVYHYVMNEDEIRKHFCYIPSDTIIGNAVKFRDMFDLNPIPYKFEVNYKPEHIDPSFIGAVTKKQKHQCDWLMGKTKFSLCRNKAKFTVLVTTNYGNNKHNKITHLCKKHFKKKFRV